MSRGAALPFVKMQGCGNDYILLDAVARPELAGGDSPWRSAVRAMCDRRTGIGADGVIVVSRGDGGVDARAEVVNADGSAGGMCGNGLRMVARLMIESGYARSDTMTVEMGGRRIVVEAERDADGSVRRARADMGAPVLEPARVPVHTAPLERVGDCSWRIGAAGRMFDMTFVSMGNPHGVIFTEALPGADEVARHGAALERHAAFPERMNVHWARMVEPGVVEAVAWERGAGATMACGTGACAVCVAGVLRGLSERLVVVHMPGGVLEARWEHGSGRVWLAGAVDRCFTGEWSGSSVSPWL